ncbi:MAG: excinuclease ABC subunit UvrC [Puniceicoccaceae bacterium]|nr:MAG: excinuclease ABC subunit UvrC [Puniceicoccaceae bacterium]
MPAPEPANLKEKVRRLPHGPGVYLMKDRLGRILYVGKAKDLKKRVSSYFQPSRGQTLHPKIRALVGAIHDFDVLEVKSEPEALLLESRLIKEWKPKYNTDFTDDKRFPMVRLDENSPIPRFQIVRFRKDDRARYFGPFPHAGLLRQTLSELRRRFGVCLADAAPVEIRSGVYRLYDDVRSEIYGFANELTPGEYRARLESAVVFLEGKSRETLRELEAEMAAAAEREEFERAAALRDLVFALRKTLTRTRKFVRDPMVAGSPREAVLRLGEALGLERPPEAIECFDISHISGSFVVASMVRFAGGAPDKANYRRYKIRTFIGNDDYRAMTEVVGRRYRRLAAEDRPFPDLVVIDGGAGQVAAALKAFLAQDLQPPPLIGLAKRRETILFSDGRPDLNLPAHDPALRLLQRLRDEAHRFANTFNADLRSRRIRESVLDDFPGLGPVRRRLLLEHFGSIERLRAASRTALAEVPGLGPKTAARLHAFLRREPESTA